MRLLLAVFAVAAANAQPGVPPAAVRGAGEEVVDATPFIVGGMEALRSAVSYPEQARLLDLEGTVIVRFAVDEAGRVVDPFVVGYPSQLLAQEALRAVRQQRFVPGLQGGELSRFLFAVPITFRLPGRGVPTLRRAPTGLIGGLRALADSVVYPDAAREAGVEGDVYVRFTVDSRGRVSEVTVLDAPSPLLVDAAVDAVRRQVFVAGRRREAVEYTVAVPFRLAGAER